MAKKKRERIRVPREDAKRAHSNDGRGGGLFKLPAGVEVWAPDKAARILLDVVPYEVKTDHHPDRIDAGSIWYRYPFAVHFGVGIDDDRFICPRSVGKPCPICEEADRLRKEDSDGNKALYKALYPQNWMAYNIVDPNNEDGFTVFAMSKGKFANPLQEELNERDDELQDFYNVIDGMGRTMKVRFSTANYQGREYLEATRIDFRPRDDMDEDQVLENTTCLDNIFDVRDYDEIKNVFEGVVDDEQSKKKGKAKKAAKEEVADDDDDEIEDEQPKKKGKAKKAAKEEVADEDDGLSIGDRVTSDEFGEDFPGEITDIDDDDFEVTFDDGDVQSFPADELTALTSEDVDEEEADDDDDEEEAEQPKKKGKDKGKKAKEEVADEDDDEEEAEADEDADWDDEEDWD